MIFNKKDIIKREDASDKQKRYYLSFGDLQIHCSSIIGVYRKVTWWACKFYYPTKDSPEAIVFKIVLDFNVRAPWSEDKMLKALEGELIMNNGKRRLIRAIYNDFEA